MSQIIQAFHQNTIRFPNKMAMICGEQKRSYQELWDSVMALASGLQNRGVQKGDTIGVLLPNCMEFVELIFAASALGVAVAPLSPTLPVDAIVKAFKAVNVSHVIGMSSCLSELLAEKFDISGLWIAIGRNISEGTLPWKDLICEESASFVPDTECDENILIFTMTSGSTGLPKPIGLTQKNKYLRAIAASQLYSVNENDCILAGTPLYHSLAERLVIMPIILGGTGVLMSHFSPKEWFQALEKYQVTFTIAVSSQLKNIVQIIKSTSHPEISSLHGIVSSSALLDSETKQALLEVLRCDFYECYGTSEIAIATSIDFESAKHKVNSVGCVIPGVELRVVREDGSDCEPGEVGEIICKTPMLFSGYYNQPEKTALAVRNGWFHTGDMGKLDEEKYLYFVSRKKDIIITGGINVYPCDIEDVIMRNQEVSACAAFPLPDEHLGEIVAVAVVPKTGIELSVQSLRFLCAKHLADFQIPHKIFIVDQLPTNSMGKLVKFKLTEMFS